MKYNLEQIAFFVNPKRYLFLGKCTLYNYIYTCVIDWITHQEAILTSEIDINNGSTLYKIDI